MFFLMNSLLAQPKPVKAYDLLEAIDRFERTSVEYKAQDAQDVTSIPTRIPRAEQHKVLAPAVESILPPHLRAVGGPISNNGIVHEEKWTLNSMWSPMPEIDGWDYDHTWNAPSFEQASEGFLECEDFFRLSSSSPLSYKDHSKSTFAPSPIPHELERIEASTQSDRLVAPSNQGFPDFMLSPSPSQLPYPPSWADTEKEVERPSSTTSFVDEWVTRIRASTYQRMHPVGPRQGPAPPGSGLARIMAMKSAQTVQIQVDDIASSAEEYTTASEGSGSTHALSDIDRVSTLSIRASSACSEYSEEGAAQAVHYPVQRADGIKKAFCDSGFFSANNSSISSFESFGEAPSIVDSPKTDLSSADSLHWNKSMGGDALSFLLEIERDLGKKVASSHLLDTITIPTTFEVPKLHWDWTMGGDAMSFLLSAEAQLRRKADNAPVGGVV